MRGPIDPEKLNLMKAALPNVAFDGWSPRLFLLLVKKPIFQKLKLGNLPAWCCGSSEHFHKWGDDQFKSSFKKQKISELKVREKIKKAVELRITISSDKEAVRRGVVLFSLPTHAVEGGRLVWDTSDLIWQLIGDESEDFNWYSKRTILSAVYAYCIILAR